ncbi:hypothetical protein HmCmsJML035_04544 [Escherichia coli]|nr:hypothetical protein [Escherichia coli]MBS9011378.1 hypothetical protein [Escherichia coli]GCV12663.1 hypothetical protein HmCmsJML035_04544 [Escherichia coli]GCX95999.1 hypothetical protein HmCmsJML077_01340 [Escherichia coli]HAM4833694.1 hypothetical protein [Escherichia coli]HEG1790503.1 hypothetical protein [Escherichia coli]
MKKLIIASAIAMTMASGAAMAADANTAQTGEVTFIGSVTAKTCDLAPSVDGIMTDVIDLGTIDVGASGVEKSFALVKKPGTTCVLEATNTADVTWGGKFTADGLANAQGSAEKAHVVLTAKGYDDAGTSDQEISSSVQTVNFTKAQEKLNADGFKFTAQLNSDAAGTAGTFLSTAYYAVAYK